MSNNRKVILLPRLTANNISVETLMRMIDDIVERDEEYFEKLDFGKWSVNDLIDYHNHHFKRTVK